MKKYGATVDFFHNLVAVDGPAPPRDLRGEGARQPSRERVEVEFDMMHVCPPQTAPDFIRVSPLADAAGWVDVDQATLRHKTYDNVWSLGDVMNAPNAKTAAAARKQAPVVADNIVADMRGRSAVAQYDGYGSCPLTVERGKIVLAEFGYGGALKPSFPRLAHRRDETLPRGLASQGEDPAADLLAGDAARQGMDGGPEKDPPPPNRAAAARPTAPGTCDTAGEPIPGFARLLDRNRDKYETILPKYLPPSTGGEAIPDGAVERPHRGGDRDDHADPAIAGLCAARGAAAQAGIYASIVPILLYALFGTSRALAVGPVAVVSLMTAAAIGQVAEAGHDGLRAAALTLALLSGAMLLAMGLFRLGFIAHFLSHPVIAGFITASGILIAASQLKHILGVPAQGHTLIEIVGSLARRTVGGASARRSRSAGAPTAFLFWVRKGLKPLLIRLGAPRTADVATGRAGGGRRASPRGSSGRSTSARRASPSSAKCPRACRR